MATTELHGSTPRHHYCASQAEREAFVSYIGERGAQLVQIGADDRTVWWFDSSERPFTADRGFIYMPLRVTVEYRMDAPADGPRFEVMEGAAYRGRFASTDEALRFARSIAENDAVIVFLKCYDPRYGRLVEV